MRAFKKKKQTTTKTTQAYKPSTEYFINPSGARAHPWWGLCVCNQPFPLLCNPRLCQEEVPRLEGIRDLSLMLAGPDELQPLP